MHNATDESWANFIMKICKIQINIIKNEKEKQPQILKKLTLLNNTNKFEKCSDMSNSEHTNLLCTQIFPTLWTNCTWNLAMI